MNAKLKSKIVNLIPLSLLATILGAYFFWLIFYAPSLIPSFSESAFTLKLIIWLFLLTAAALLTYLVAKIGEGISSAVEKALRKYLNVPKEEFDIKKPL